MLRSIYLVAVSAFALTGFANAQILIGSGLGKDCYLAAKSTAANASREETCTSAIESHTLTRRNRMASHINRGIIRMHIGKTEEALEDYARASQIDPLFGPTYLNAGAARIIAGYPEEAIDDLTKALELDTKDPHAAHYNLGLAYELTGDVTSAYYAFNKALEIKPDWELPIRQLERFAVVSEG